MSLVVMRWPGEAEGITDAAAGATVAMTPSASAEIAMVIRVFRVEDFILIVPFVQREGWYPAEGW